MNSKMREIERIYARARAGGKKGKGGKDGKRGGKKGKGPPMDKRMLKVCSGCACVQACMYVRVVGARVLKRSLSTHRLGAAFCCTSCFFFRCLKLILVCLPFGPDILQDKRAAKATEKRNKGKKGRGRK